MQEDLVGKKGVEEDMPVVVVERKGDFTEAADTGVVLVVVAEVVRYHKSDVINFVETCF